MNLSIPKLSLSATEISPENLVETLKRYGQEIKIETLNWEQFLHKPSVRSFLGHSETSLFVYYEVENDYLRAECLCDNDPIWEDSCVELFITISDEKYMNIEANCLGNILSARRFNREEKELLSEPELLQIKRYGSITEAEIQENVLQNWNLLLVIPKTLVNLHERKDFKANLYKCGSSTRVPHYLTAFSIATAKPDFHRPEYFVSFLMSD